MWKILNCKTTDLEKNTWIPTMLWQISVLLDTNTSVQVFVNEDCSMSELIQKIKAHPNIPKGSGYRFYTSDGLTFEDDNNNGNKRLSAFQLRDKSSITLSIGLAGGVWPTEKQIWDRPRNPKPSQRFMITDSSDHPDVLGLDDDNPRVIMPCGHAIAPLSLAHHCAFELQDNKPEICCPVDKCKSTWPFSLIREAACLSDEETIEFEHKLLVNLQNAEVKQCPNCLVSCHRKKDMDKRVTCLNCKSKGKPNCDFCWNCLHPWAGRGNNTCGNPTCNDNSPLFKILAECTTKELLGTQCPILRACPKCFIIIEHTEKCKHMTCKRCRYEFCFICLKTHLWLFQSKSLCEVAPRQTPATSDISESQCVII